MTYILDTNIISELRKVGGGKGDANVATWFADKNADDMFVSAISIMEIDIGILRAERKDLTKGKILRHWFEERVLSEFRDRILPFDHLVAQRCARLHVPDPKSDRYAMIAATAFHHSMTVITQNTKDFKFCQGVDLIDPFKS